MGAGEQRKEQKANTGRSTKKTSRGKKETEGGAETEKGCLRGPEGGG